MGKKKKRKIKKLLRAQAIAQQQELAKTEAAAEIQKPEVQKETLEQPSEEATRVKKDIKKILLTIGLLVIIIIAVYLVNIKTDFILKLGVWISQALNINV